MALAPGAALTAAVVQALRDREAVLPPPGVLDPGAQRLYHGFREAAPDAPADLALDRFGATLVIHDYADPPRPPDLLLEALLPPLQARLALTAVVHKPRRAATPELRRGAVIWGGPPARRLVEDGGRYALDLLLARDAGFFLDTRHLRAWARTELGGGRVLNAFAYTGSLGVAAALGGAAAVVHLDRSRAFLNVAKESYALNGLPVRRADFLTGDFFALTAQMKRQGRLFDAALLDPPVVAGDAYRGRVDLQAGQTALLNKLRPLLADGGRIAVVNNAIFLSGRDFLAELAALGADGYLTVERLLPVPADFCGVPRRPLPADPSPFNHSTKIAILRVRRKDGAR